MSKLFYFLSIILVSFLHCDTATPEEPEVGCPNAESFEMRNFSDLAGCSWMLVKGDLSYEVINLGDFYDSFGADVNVMVELKTRDDLASACQAGIISEIVCKQ